MLESSKVRAIFIHGRTAQQKYARKANWTVIKQCKDKISIPVIGNGDIKTYAQGIERMKESGCDGVMIGREAKYCPWIFSNKRLSNNDIKNQIFRFIELYELNENRFSLNEIKDECFRMSREIKTKYNKRKLKSLSKLDDIRKYISNW